MPRAGFLVGASSSCPLPFALHRTMADRFCSQCGAELVPEASFCVECGRALAGKRPRPRTRVQIGRYAPVLVGGSVVVIAAAAIVLGRYNPTPPPSLPGRSAPQAGRGTAGGVPEGHPPIELPEEVKRSIGEMREKAAAAPDDLAVWKQLAAVQYRAGQLDTTYLPEADASYRHILERDPTNLDALRNRGNIAFDREEAGQAIEFYRRYLAEKPDDLNVQTDLATMHLAQGDADAAVKLYEKVIAQKPDFFQALFNLGIALRTQGDVEQSVAYFQQARAVAPDERARKQVDDMLTRVAGTPAVETAPGEPAPADAFQDAVESIFRTHPMVGPKVERIDWSSDAAARILLRDFPMSAMPDEVRKRFVDRVRGQLKEKKEATGKTTPITIELVDAADQTVMQSVTE